MPMPTRLNIDKWVYHTFHLADGLDDAPDCFVCKWYCELQPATRVISDEMGGRMDDKMGNGVDTRVHNLTSATIAGREHRGMRTQIQCDRSSAAGTAAQCTHAQAETDRATGSSRHEELRDRAYRRHDRTGSEKLFARDLRPDRNVDKAGVGAVVYEQG